MSRSISNMLALACAAALTLAVPAKAEVKAGAGNFELVGGWYMPENEGTYTDPDDGFTYGLRGGYNFTKHFGMQLGLFGADLDYEYSLPAPLGDGAADISSLYADVSFLWHINPDSRATFHFFGGPGYAWQNIEVPSIPNPDFEDDDDVFTWHLGLGADIGVTDNFYIRPDISGRWFMEDEEDANGPLLAGTDSDSHSDWQFTLGFGWRFGG